MAIVRGASAAAGQIELCVGDDIKTIYVDAQGQPTKAPHICPECIISMADALGFDPAVILCEEFSALGSGTVATNFLSDDQSVGFVARAPPGWAKFTQAST